MKTLRIFNPGIPLDVKSTAYVDIECSEWTIANQVLHILRPKGILYVPLANIGAFSEQVPVAAQEIGEINV